MLVLLPADAPPAAVPDLPGLEAVRLPADGSLPDLDEVERVEVVALDPRDRDRLVALVPHLPKLSLVQTLNAGVDWVPELPAGVTLCSGSGVHDGPVSEWIVAVVLAAMKRLPWFLAEQAHGRWDTSANLAFGDGPPAEDLGEASVLVVGHGSIGRALEARLAAFGTTVVGVARRPRPGVQTPDALPGLLPAADVVVLLAPATPETVGMVDAAFLTAMKPGALLVNASRGSLVDQDALVAALRAGRVRAALDATAPEPLPPDDPLWTCPGVIVTPHVAGSSARWRERAWALVRAQLERLSTAQPLLNVVR